MFGVVRWFPYPEDTLPCVCLTPRLGVVYLSQAISTRKQGLKKYMTKHPCVSVPPYKWSPFIFGYLWPGTSTWRKLCAVTGAKRGGRSFFRRYHVPWRRCWTGCSGQPGRPYRSRRREALQVWLTKGENLPYTLRPVAYLAHTLLGQNIEKTFRIPCAWRSILSDTIDREIYHRESETFTGATPIGTNNEDFYTL